MKAQSLAGLAGVFLLPATIALADGAIAIGMTSDIAKDGVAVGVTTGFSTAGLAGGQALVECQASALGSAAVDQCRVVRTFSNMCVAVSADPRPDTGAFGYGVGSSEVSAIERAFAMCRQSAAEGELCNLVGVRCDATPIASGGPTPPDTPPGDNPPGDPDNGRGWAYASSGASSVSFASTRGDPSATTIQSGGEVAASSPNSGASASHSTGGGAGATESETSSSGSGGSETESAGASSSTSGSSCAGAHC